MPHCTLLLKPSQNSVRLFWIPFFCPISTKNAENSSMISSDLESARAAGAVLELMSRGGGPLGELLKLPLCIVLLLKMARMRSGLDFVADIISAPAQLVPWLPIDRDKAAREVRGGREWKCFSEVTFYLCSSLLPQRSPIRLSGWANQNCTKKWLHVSARASLARYKVSPISQLSRSAMHPLPVEFSRRRSHIILFPFFFRRMSAQISRDAEEICSEPEMVLGARNAKIPRIFDQLCHSFFTGRNRVGH